MELTNKQIQEIQEELDQAVKMQSKLTRQGHPFELDHSAYARWAYWNGKEVQVRKIQKILGL
jgi:hypothetical protein